MEYIAYSMLKWWHLITIKYICNIFLCLYRSRNEILCIYIHIHNDILMDIFGGERGPILCIMATVKSRILFADFFFLWQNYKYRSQPWVAIEQKSIFLIFSSQFIVVLTFSTADNCFGLLVLISTMR